MISTYKKYKDYLEIIYILPLISRILIYIFCKEYDILVHLFWKYPLECLLIYIFVVLFDIHFVGYP